MAKDIMFLLRGGDGQMRTIMAPNKTQAMKTFLKKYPARAGDEISLKVRGEGDWEEYEVR
jgi:hypothetical protein